MLNSLNFATQKKVPLKLDLKSTGAQIILKFIQTRGIEISVKIMLSYTGFHAIKFD